MINNQLQDILAKFKFSRNSGDRAVGVDIGSSSIKVVEVKKKNGRAVLGTYGMISLGPYDNLEIGRVTNLPAEKIVEALKETLKQSRVSTTSSALAIPAQSSLIFVIELPGQIKKSEISSVVPTEARKYIPVPIDEVSLDWFVLPKKEISFEEANNPELASSPPEKIEVLAIAIQNDTILKYRSIVKESKLTAGFFEVEIFSSIRSNLEHELSPVLLMDFGASLTKLSILEFGTVKRFHLIDRGGADISDAISKSLGISFSAAEEMKKEYGLFGNPKEKNLAEVIKTHLDYIFSETNNVLLGYEKKYSRVIDKVILTGGGSSLKGLKEVALNNFKGEVVLSRPFSKIGTPAFLEKVLETIGPEFGVAVGLALRKLK
jgi:type IV pilus assembly protein PilM